MEYYRKKMQAVGLEPGDIRGIEDLERLPFTTKDDLRDTYPFGMFAVPNSQITRIHASSGTTGKSTVVGYTRKDIDVWSECVAGALPWPDWEAMTSSRWLTAYGLFTGGLGAHYGAEEMGATVVPHVHRQHQEAGDHDGGFRCDRNHVYAVLPSSYCRNHRVRWGSR